jgi:hypothetical protein
MLHCLVVPTAMPEHLSIVRMSSLISRVFLQRGLEQRLGIAPHPTLLGVDPFERKLAGGHHVRVVGAALKTSATGKCNQLTAEQQALAA